MNRRLKERTSYSMWYLLSVRFETVLNGYYSTNPYFCQGGLPQEIPESSRTGKMGFFAFL